MDKHQTLLLKHGAIPTLPSQGKTQPRITIPTNKREGVGIQVEGGSVSYTMNVQARTALLLRTERAILRALKLRPKKSG